MFHKLCTISEGNINTIFESLPIGAKVGKKKLFTLLKKSLNRLKIYTDPLVYMQNQVKMRLNSIFPWEFSQFGLRLSIFANKSAICNFNEMS